MISVLDATDRDWLGRTLLPVDHGRHRIVAYVKPDVAAFLIVTRAFGTDSQGSVRGTNRRDRRLADSPVTAPRTSR